VLVIDGSSTSSLALVLDNAGKLPSLTLDLDGDGLRDHELSPAFRSGAFLPFGLLARVVE
jgi:hypothetical protein